jgi:glyceraldehyde 3-phosphate dehydrogenase
MAKLRVAVNGMGRIGRTLLREWYNRGIQDFEIVAVNNPGNPDPYLHLLRYDSVHGKFLAEVSMNGSKFNVGNKSLEFYSVKDPSEIPWKNQEVDLVIDATGRFKDQKSLGKHIGDTVKKVIMCAPGKDLDGTFVMGINHDQYDPTKHHIISNASCTTNCLAPIAKVLNDAFEIQNGFMTTVHAYTSDQQLLDGAHTDLRRARAAAMSMIPTSTGAASAVGLVIPELAGKLDGFAVRVPTPNVSMVDLTVNVKKSTTAAEINNLMKEASRGSLKNILGYAEEELVSNDFNGSRESSIFDPFLTNVIGQTVKVVAWYDNEVGFSNRVIDLVSHVASKA